MNILIIEDDLILQRAMTFAFTQTPNKIYVAKDGMEALEMVEENEKMDVIICDIMMPVVSGATFISLFNEHRFKNTPIIVISALKDGEEFLKKHNIKYSYFINKPFEISYLKNIVNGFKTEE